MKKDIDLPIAIRTGCRIGSHAFTYTGGQPRFCDCGAYSWEEYQKELAEAKVEKP